MCGLPSRCQEAHLTLKNSGSHRAHRYHARICLTRLDEEMARGRLIDDVVGDLIDLNALVFKEGDHSPWLFARDTDMADLGRLTQLEQRVERPPVEDVLNLCW